MPPLIEDIDFRVEEPDLAPLRTQIRERDARTVSIISRARKSMDLQGIAGEIDDVSREQFESFADRLINENIAKQAEPERVARHIARYSRLLGDERDRRSKPFVTAHVPQREHSDYPRTIFGTEAWIGRRYAPKSTALGYVPRFLTRVLALPCVERSVRREVMFAKRKAGRGYRVKHRRGPYTDIWC